MRLSSEARQAAWLTIGTWTLSALLYLIPFGFFQKDPIFYVALTVFNICLLGALLSVGVYWTARRARQRHWTFRFAAVAAAVILAAASLAMLDGLLGQILADTVYIGRPATPFAFRAVNNFAALVWQFALLGAAFTVIETSNVARQRERDLAAAREATDKAQAAATAAHLAALRYQLNPHFLFNTLNAISSLIVTRDYAPADAMLAKLSDFLRATLSADNEAVIPLEDELATLQHYLEIESVRFGERLAIEFRCPADLNDAMVPSFALQPLVENAIKYAVAPSAETVTIRIEAAADGEDLVLMVEDDGHAEPGAVKSGTGLGIANIRQRLATLYEGRASIETVRRESGFIAIMRMPLQRRLAAIPARVA